MMDLFLAIQKDDIKQFESLIQNGYSKCISFGRFPILSVCYLYSSKKIIKKYEKELIQINSYIRVDEPNELYLQFKSTAKRVLRIYAGKDNIVSPLEMLLILEKTATLDRVYKEAYKNNLIQENLSLIQKIKTSEVLTASETRIDIPKLPLKKKSKRILIAMSAVFIVMIILSSFVLGWFNYMGVGTDTMPLHVYNDSQLISYLNKGVEAIKLVDDIEIDSLNIDSLDTKIDGNGKKLILKNQQSAIINTNNSTIKNLDIEIEKIFLEIEDDFALLTLTNNGTIDNVSINVELDFTINNVHDEEDVVDLYISLFCFKNYGSIKNCTTSSTIQSEGDGKTNASVSAFCGINYKEITQCSTGDDFSLTTKNVDVGVISALNMEEGSINSCNIKGKVEQKGVGKDWNPNIGGVVIENCGNINESRVLADISCSSDSSDYNSAGYISKIYVGGIAAINDYGEIKSCLCSSQIDIDSDFNEVYVGGIASINYMASQENIGIIDKCAAKESISLNVKDSRSYVYAGGIVGANYGVISGSYCIGNFEINMDLEELYCGAIVGVISQNIYSSFVWNGTLYMYNNIFLITNGFYKSAGQNISLSSFYDYTGVGYSSLDEIKQEEVYWE